VERTLRLTGRRSCAQHAAVGSRRAGEAASAVLLTATVLGLASCPITEPLEVAETRAALRSEIFESVAFPQMLLRIGWARDNGPALPLTPRRPLE
jgi:nitroreductase